MAVLQAGLVLALCGNAPAALGFFAFAFALVMLKARVPDRYRALYQGCAIVLLVVLTLRFRTPLGPHLGRLKPIFTLDLTFLGLSYAFLRIVRALLDRRVWSWRALVRYYFFFPTFFSGPVMEPGEMDAPAGAADVRARGRLEGLRRILEGIVRIGAATLLSNVTPLDTQAHLFFSRAWPPLLLWAGAFASGVWLYLNFSGYSEVYIGLARLFGVEAPENFDHPFGASDITAFWRRWHMSLGSWLRSTIYAPLSRALVSRKETGKTAAGLLAPIAAMLVCGAWHMVAPTFLVWGLLHGLGLAAHWTWGQVAVPRLSESLRRHVGYRALSWLGTHAFVALSWTFFLPVDPSIGLLERGELVKAMFGMGG